MNLRRRSTRRKTGFTLPEIIVTISLIAALAAVVVPTVISQVKKGDPSRIGNDFLAVRGASEQFLTDIRKYPSSMYQLTNVITTSQTGLVGTSIANYGQAEVNRWRGPYLNKDSAAARITGYGLTDEHQLRYGVAGFERRCERGGTEVYGHCDSDDRLALLLSRWTASSTTACY